MSLYMGGNVVLGGGGKVFNIHSNLTPSFEIGNSKGGDVWLEGSIVDGEFLFNGRLYLKDGSFGTVIDSFPKGVTPGGWSQNRLLDVEGYQLIDKEGEIVFAYHVEGNICFVDVNLYNSAGELVATGGQGGLVIHGISFCM